MRAAIASIVGVVLGYGAIQPPPFAGGPVTSSGPTTCQRDGVLYDVNGVQGCTLPTNMAPRNARLKPQANYPGGTQTAATTYLAGGIDEFRVDIDAADTCNAADTVTVPIDGTSNVLTYGTEWCSGSCTTRAQRVTSLTAAIDALGGVTATETGGTTVYIWPDSTTLSIGPLAESDANCSTVTSGTNGSVQFFGTFRGQHANAPGMLNQAGTANAPNLFLDAASQTAGWSYAGGTINGIIGGSRYLYFGGTSLNMGLGTTLTLDGSTTIAKHFSSTASLDYDLSGAGITCQDLTITVTGASTTNNSVVAGVPNALASTAGVTFTAWVSAADTCSVRMCDVTSGNPNPAAATIRCDVWQH